MCGWKTSTGTLLYWKQHIPYIPFNMHIVLSAPGHLSYQFSHILRGCFIGTGSIKIAPVPMKQFWRMWLKHWHEPCHPHWWWWLPQGLEFIHCENIIHKSLKILNLGQNNVMAFQITGPLWGESICKPWIQFTKGKWCVVSEWVSEWVGGLVGGRAGERASD